MTLQHELADIPYKMHRGTFATDKSDYSSVDNFQMSALFQHDYDDVIRSGQNGIYEICSLKLLTVLAVAVLFQV